MSPIILNIIDEIVVESFTIRTQLEVDLSLQKDVNRSQLQKHQQNKDGMLLVTTEALAMNKNCFSPADYFPK